MKTTHRTTLAAGLLFLGLLSGSCKDSRDNDANQDDVNIHTDKTFSNDGVYKEGDQTEDTLQRSQNGTMDNMDTVSPEGRKAAPSNNP
jgi:hypothetical protein